MTNPVAAGLAIRVTLLERRLDRLAATPTSGLTAPEPTTGERWEAGHIWSHVAEFIPYWLEQCSVLQAAREQGLPPPQFGRSKDDVERVERIQRGRADTLDRLVQRCHAELELLRGFIEKLPAEAWAAAGTPKPYVEPSVQKPRGLMTIEQIVSEYILDHGDDHASQLAAMVTG